MSPSVILGGKHLSNSELVHAVHALGPEFEPYANSLEEDGTVDSTYLQTFEDRDWSLLYTLVPKAHQVKLDILFGFDSVDPEDSIPAANMTGRSEMDALLDHEKTARLEELPDATDDEGDFKTIVDTVAAWWDGK
jgi:hypothetical protein